MTFPKEHFALHEYASYDEYRRIQSHHNKRKLSNTWADEVTLEQVARRVEQEFPEGVRFGLCHGARNGFEQNWLADRLRTEVTGTDISDTAADFPRSVIWDFHDPNPDWKGRCDFVYSNSWDHSQQPRKALKTWLGQVRTGGLVFIEHTRKHGPEGQSEMDPFGVTPEFVPYLLTDWFGHRITIEVIHGEKPNKKKLAVWLFVLKRLA